MVGARIRARRSWSSAAWGIVGATGRHADPSLRARPLAAAAPEPATPGPQHWSSLDADVRAEDQALDSARDPRGVGRELRSGARSTSATAILAQGRSRTRSSGCRRQDGGLIDVERLRAGTSSSGCGSAATSRWPRAGIRGHVHRARAGRRLDGNSRGDGRQAAVRLKPRTRGATAARTGRSAGGRRSRRRTAPTANRPRRQVPGAGACMSRATQRVAALFEAAGSRAGCRTWHRARRTGAAPPSADDRARPRPRRSCCRTARARIELRGRRGNAAVDARTAWLGKGRDEACRRGRARLERSWSIGERRRRGAAWLRVTLDDHPAAVELLRVRTAGGWGAWIPTRNAAGMTRGADG